MYGSPLRRRCSPWAFFGQRVGAVDHSKIIGTAAVNQTLFQIVIGDGHFYFLHVCVFHSPFPSPFSICLAQRFFGHFVGRSIARPQAACHGHSLPEKALLFSGCRAGNARPYQSFLCRSVQQKKPQQLSLYGLTAHLFFLLRRLFAAAGAPAVGLGLGNIEAIAQQVAAMGRDAGRTRP